MNPVALSKTETKSKEERLIQALRKANLRLTPQRIAICRYLANTDTHPTSQEIYRALKPEYPSLSLATVYNTLSALVELGAIHALGDAGDDTTHYDPEIEPHINLMCVRCHRIIDLPEEAVAELEKEAAERTGFRIFGARVVYYGLCPDCQRELEKEGQEKQHGRG